MIQITTQPNKKTTDKQYKINTSFNSLQKYIDNYEMKECNSNIDVLTNVCCLKGCNYLETPVYSYQYGECIPYGTITGETFKPSCRQVISTRILGICRVGSYNCILVPEKCIWESFQYSLLPPEYNGYTTAVTSEITGGSCPVACSYEWPIDASIWPCTRLCCYGTCEDNGAWGLRNPIQLSNNTWVCIGMSMWYTSITGLPIIPVGTTMGIYKPWNELFPGSARCYTRLIGVPIMFVRDNNTIITAYCPEIFCVNTNSGGTITLLEYNLRNCGAHCNNTLVVNLPMTIDNCFKDNMIKWYNEYYDAGYSPRVCLPSIWNATFNMLQPYAGEYSYCNAQYKYYTIGCTMYESDVNQVVFKGAK